MVTGPEATGMIWNTGNANWMVEEISLRMIQYQDSGPQRSWDPIAGGVQNQLDKSQSNLIYQ